MSEISNYINACRAQGIGDDTIRAKLLEAGWQSAQVDSGFSEAGSRASKIFSAIKNHLGAAIGIILAVIVIFGLFLLYAKASPNAIWNKFANNKTNYFAAIFQPGNSWHADFLVNYQDANQTNATLELQGDVDAGQSGNTEADANLSLSGEAQNQNFSYKTNLVYLDKSAYVDVSDIPTLGNYVQPYNGWVQLNIAEIPPQALQQIKDEWAKINQNTLTQGNNLQALEQQGIIKHKYAGVQKINGIYAYHYTLDINKSALKNLITKYEDNSLGILAAVPAYKNSLDAINNEISTYVDTVKINQDDIWLSVPDGLPVKSVLNFSIPSPAALSGVNTQEIGNGQDISNQIKALSQENKYAVVDMELNFSQLNEKLNLHAPAKSLDIIKAYASMQNSNQNSNQNSEQNPSMPLSPVQ